MHSIPARRRQQANTAYTAGQLFVDANVGNRQVVTTAGTSGGTAPSSWNSTSGGTTTDGGVTWTNSGVGWQPLFVDCSAVVRSGGLPRRRYALPAQATQPALAQARINQLSEQLAQTLATGTAIGNLSALFTTLPPSGILPVSAVNFTSASAALAAAQLVPDGGPRPARGELEAVTTGKPGC